LPGALFDDFWVILFLSKEKKGKDAEVARCSDRLPVARRPDLTSSWAQCPYHAATAGGKTSQCAAGGRRQTEHLLHRKHNDYAPTNATALGTYALHLPHHLRWIHTGATPFFMFLYFLILFVLLFIFILFGTPSCFVFRTFSRHVYCFIFRSLAAISFIFIPNYAVAATHNGSFSTHRRSFLQGSYIHYGFLQS
jgi:hypothetical protein